jgi:hypothetical protein
LVARFSKPIIFALNCGNESNRMKSNCFALRGFEFGLSICALLLIFWRALRDETGLDGGSNVLVAFTDDPTLDAKRSAAIAIQHSRRQQPAARREYDCTIMLHAIP